MSGSNFLQADHGHINSLVTQIDNKISILRALGKRVDQNILEMQASAMQGKSGNAALVTGGQWFEKHNRFNDVLQRIHDNTHTANTTMAAQDDQNESEYRRLMGTLGF